MILIWKGKPPVEPTLTCTHRHWNKGSIKNIWNKEDLPSSAALSPPARMSQRQLDRTSARTKARRWKWVLNDLVLLCLPRCGHSPVYRSREMAARALVPLVMVDEIPNTIRTLLAKLPNSTDQRFRQNHIHGTLLQVSDATLCQTTQDKLWFLTYC